MLRRVAVEVVMVGGWWCKDLVGKECGIVVMGKNSELNIVVWDSGHECWESESLEFV